VTESSIALDVIDAIRSAQPNALPATVVVDMDAKQVRIVMQEEATDNVKNRVYEKLQGLSVKYDVDKGIQVGV
jgi:hypothetical protein